MKVRDIMSESPKYCGPDTNLAAATEIMWANDCGALPVVDSEGKVLGMLTDRDICIALGTKAWVASETSVSEITPWRVVACAPEDDIQVAIGTMQTEKVRRLPVVSPAGTLLGILSLNDLALHAKQATEQRISALSYEDVVETLKAICEHRIPQPGQKKAVA